MKNLAITIVVMAISVAYVSAQNLTPQQDTKKNTWGYVDASGSWAVKPKWDKAGSFSIKPNGAVTAEVEAKDLKGFIDTTGKPLGIGVAFTDITPLDGNALIVTVKDKKGIIDYNGIYLIKPELTSVTRLDDTHYVIDLKGRKGLIDNTGKILITPKDATGIKPHTQPGVWQVEKNGKVGLQREGQEKPFVDYKYLAISDPFNVPGQNVDFYLVKDNKGRVGVVNSGGKKVLDTMYEDIDIFPGKNNVFLCYMDEFNRKYYSYDFHVWVPGVGIDAFRMDNYSNNGGITKLAGQLNYDTSIDKEIVNRYFGGDPYVRMCFDEQGNSYPYDTDIKKMGNLLAIKRGDYYTITKPDGTVLLQNIKDAKFYLPQEGNFQQDDFYVMGNYIVTLNNVYNAITGDSFPADYVEVRSSSIDRNYLKQEDGLYHEYYGSDKHAPTGNVYENVSEGGDYMIFTKDGKTGIYQVTSSAPRLIAKDAQGDDIEYISDGHGGKKYIIKQNGKYGIYDLESETYTYPPEYDLIEHMPIAHLLVLKKGGKAWCQKSYKSEKSESYDDIKIFDKKSSIVIIVKNGLEGIFDANTNTVLAAPKYKDITYNDETMMYDAKKNGAKISITQEGAELTGPKAVFGDYKPKAKYSSGYKYGQQYIKVIDVIMDAYVYLAKDKNCKTTIQLTENGKPLSGRIVTLNYVPDSNRYHEDFSCFFNMWDDNWAVNSARNVGVIVKTYVNGKLANTLTKSF
ncbi:MAG: WG repeat-containing protein [Muribaculaceae bacterium]|nr:WG repeat-containing protein [Muribaculaceae bacterium]